MQTSDCSIIEDQKTDNVYEIKNKNYNISDDNNNTNSTSNNKSNNNPLPPRIHTPLPCIWLLWREDDQPKIMLQNLVPVQKLLDKAGKHLYGKRINAREK